MTTENLQDDAVVTASMAAIKHIRVSVEEFFALNPMPDTCIDASNRAGRKFSEHFPGWELYARIIRGETGHDARLREWVIAGGRMLAQSKGKSGQPYIKPSKLGEWIDAAALDALRAVIGLPIPHEEFRAAQFGIAPQTFLRIYNPIAGMMAVGLALFTQELEYQWGRVKNDERKLNRDIRESESRAIVGRDRGMFASGCAVTPSAGESDDVTGRDDATLYHGLKSFEAWRAEYEAPGPVVDIPVADYVPANIR